jgi:prevent-host-death family protein
VFAFWKRWSRQSRQTGLSRPTSRDELAQYNTYDARSALSQLLKRVQEGEQIVIARAGEPVALLVPYVEPIETRPGVLRLSLLVHDAPKREDGNSTGASRRGGVPPPQLRDETGLGRTAGG